MTVKCLTLSIETFNGNSQATLKQRLGATTALIVVAQEVGVCADNAADLTA